jgi:hypothetical protein
MTLVFMSKGVFVFSARLVLSMVFTFSSVFSFAQRPINIIRPLATSQLPSYRYDDYDLEKYDRLKQDAVSRYSDAKRRYETINRDYNQSVDRDQRLAQNLQTQGRRLEVLRREDQELQRAVQQNQQTISQNEQAVPRLESEASTLQNQVGSTEKVIEDLKAKLAGAGTDAEKQEIQKQIDAQTGILNNLKSQLSSKQREAQQAKSRLEEARNQLTQNGRKLESNRREAQGLESQISDLQRQIEVARRETLERQRARDLAENEMQSRAREVEVTERNVENVRRNIQIARQILEDQGTEQGANDGQREGLELGTQRGSRDGQSVGSTDGRNQGIKDGRARDYNTGYANGQSRATQDALRQSEADAQKNATRDGLEQGRIDGLKNAYNLGLQEGLKHGAETGSDREAYNQGRKEGEAAGLAKAVEDAKPQEPLGYQDKEREYLNAPLKNVVVGDPSLANKFEGVQGRFSEDGDDRYYRPQPGNLPHNRLERFYMDSYDRSYRRELGETYRATYRREYDLSYNESYRRLYDENFRVKYPDSEKSGYDKGYADTYQPQYDSNYRVRYAEIYKINYDANFEKFKLDVNERARGFKDGNRTASKAKGYDEGFRAAYAANIEIEKKKAYAAGVARAKQLYDNNPIIQVLSLDLKDVDADGINRPGENLSVVMKLKNFGLKSKIDLASLLTDTAGSIQVTQARINTGVIPEQSNATVVVPVQSLVPASAVDGKALSVTLQAVSGQTIHASERKTLAVQFPTQISIVGFDGILIPGVSTAVKLRVLNRSKSVQNLNVSVAVDTSKVDIAQNQFQVSQLQPKTEQEVTLNLTGKLEARFEESPLEIKTAQGALQFAMNVGQSMTIIRKHSPTADSKGLIISQNLAVGAGKKLFGLENLDTWDLRVDGSISNKSVLASYKGKIIHVLADSGSSADAQTLTVLKQFIAENGSVMIWGGSLNRTSLGQGLMEALGVSVVQNQVLNGTIQGIEKMRGLSVNYQGELSILRHNSQKGSYALNSSVGVPGVIVFGNGIDSKTAQVAVLGLDLMNVDETSAKALINQVEVIRSSFDEKMKRAWESPSQQMWLVVQDMVDEMLAAELLGTGNFYKNNSENNKLFRAGKRMIADAGRNSAQARELAKAYPLLMETIEKRLSKEKWRAELVLEKRHGSFVNARNLKDLYCANNSGHRLCQQQPGN